MEDRGLDYWGSWIDGGTRDCGTGRSGVLENWGTGGLGNWGTE